jgi:Ca2+-dependent lipid-binding protein
MEHGLKLSQVNLRLLLSATPPFAKTATFSFTRLPDFDISAKPLAKAAFNAMELPGMKSYGKPGPLAFRSM